MSIKSLDDVAGAVARHRYHVSDYALRFEDSYEPDDCTRRSQQTATVNTSSYSSTSTGSR